MRNIHFLKEGQKQEDIALQDIYLSQISYKYQKYQFLTKDQINTVTMTLLPPPPPVVYSHRFHLGKSFVWLYLLVTYWINNMDKYALSLLQYLDYV